MTPSFGRGIVSRMNAATLSIVCPKKLVDVTTLTSNTYGDVWNDARVYWFFRFGFLITWVKESDLDQTSLPCTHTLYDSIVLSLFFSSSSSFCQFEINKKDRTLFMRWNEYEEHRPINFFSIEIKTHSQIFCFHFTVHELASQTPEGLRDVSSEPSPVQEMMLIQTQVRLTYFTSFA